MSSTDSVSANVEQFSGFADIYDRHRPSPPPVLTDLLIQYAGGGRPSRVVDLGSGTGLSTRIWADKAAAVIGVEPNADMRRQAESSTKAANIRYQDGLGTTTGLPDGCADVVTVVQALHWMEPTATFAEVGRILRIGGVFAAVDNRWPPLYHWEAEQAEADFMAQARAIDAKLGYVGRDSVIRWSKHEHLARMAASGVFRHTCEALLHSVEMGDAERLVGLVLSQGHIEALLKRGVTEEVLGVPELRAAAHYILGDAPQLWYFSYQVRIGVK